MLVLSVLSVFVGLVAGRGSPPNPGYGGYGNPQGPTTPAYEPQVFRHVYVHVAPDEKLEKQSRTIRVPGGDKHVNIIFVKTPSSSSQQDTEVILPEQDTHKSLVYVLLKKGGAENNIRIRRPTPGPQRKPEVYFIQYKGQDKEASEYGRPPTPLVPEKPSYGYPSRY